MANQEITGRTSDGLEDLEEEWLTTKRGKEGVPLDDAYCLTRIQGQPDDYDGPDRFCVNYTCQNRTDFCNTHRHYLHLDKLANMSHGVRALRQNLKTDFGEDEQEAYDEIVEEWSEYYGIDDPGSIDTLESMAIEIIREVRADAVIQDARNETGDGLTIMRTVYFEDQPIDREAEAHYMPSERRAIRNSIQKMKDDLGITRKHQDRMDAEEDKASQLNALSEQVSDSIDGGEYDPADFTEEDNEEETEND